MIIIIVMDHEILITMMITMMIMIMIQPTRWQHQATGDRRRDDEFNTFEVSRDMAWISFYTAHSQCQGSLFELSSKQCWGCFSIGPSILGMGSFPMSMLGMSFYTNPKQCKDPFLHSPQTMQGWLFTHLNNYCTACSLP